MNVCISTTHTTPVEATVLGIFNPHGYGDNKPSAVRYCASCALYIGTLGFFTPKDSSATE